MKAQVCRPHPSLVVTPATTCGAGWQVTVRCGKCRVYRPLAVSERFHSVREVDWATLFQRLTFRCRCRSLADALRVERLTKSGPEEVLHAWVRTDYHG